MTLPDAEALAAMVEAAAEIAAERREKATESLMIAGLLPAGNAFEMAAGYATKTAEVLEVFPCLAQEVIRLTESRDEWRLQAKYALDVSHAQQEEIARLTAVVDEAKRVAAETVQANAAIMQRLDEAISLLRKWQDADTFADEITADMATCNFLGEPFDPDDARAFLGGAP